MSKQNTNNSDSTPQLFMIEIPQLAWHLQQPEALKQSKKPMDKMPLAEIIKLYERGVVLCDSCGKEMEISECAYTLIEHIVHLINPNTMWSCEGCYLEDKRKGKIIAECEIQSGDSVE